MLPSDPLGLLFLLDDRLVPTFLDYAQSYGQGLDQDVLFLLEVDRLRFNNSNTNTNTNNIISNTNKDVNETVEFMSRIIKYNCILSNTNINIISTSDVSNIKKLISTKIPLKASFAEICERIWKRVLLSTENMPMSPNWTALRKCLIDDNYSYIPDIHSSSDNTNTNKKFELFTILNDDNCRSYFQQYLLKKNNINAATTKSATSYYKYVDLVSYDCWLDVRNILSKLELLKASNDDSNDDDDDTDVNKRTSSSSSSDYIDHSEVFKLLLKEMRLLHKRFGFNLLPSSKSSTSSVVPMYSASVSPSSSLSSPMALNKLSPTICVELSSTLTLCSSISLADIESVDNDFANTCILKFQKQLLVLERETFQHLQKQFEGYIQSIEFVRMIIRQKCQSSTNCIPQLQKYIRTIEFLEAISKLPGSMLKPHTIIYDNEIEDMAGNVLMSYKTLEAITNTSTTATNRSKYLGNVLCIYSELESTGINNFSVANIRILKGLENIESSKLTVDVKYMEAFADNSRHNLMVILHLLKHLGKVDISSKTLVDDDSNSIIENSTIYSTNMNIGSSSSSLIKISPKKNKAVYDAIVKCYPDYYNANSSSDVMIHVGYAFEGSLMSSTHRLGLVISVPSLSTPTTLVKTIRDVAIQTAHYGHTDHFQVYGIDMDIDMDMDIATISTTTPYHESLKDLYAYAYKDDNNETCYNPVRSLLGPADFSICKLILSSSLRLVTHILFLLLSNKNVVLVSQSTTLLSEFILSLPRLCWPFRLYHTHDIDMLMQLDLIEIWWSNILSGDIKRSFLVGLKADIFYSSSMYKYLLYNQASIARRDTKKFEQHTNIEESFDMVVVDIDKSTIIFPSETQTLLSSLSSSLSPTDVNDNDSVIYRMPFSYCFSQVTLRFKSGPFLELDKTLQSLFHQNSIKNIDIENNIVETAWFKYFSKIFLKELPQQIVHYPTQMVIGCNIDNILNCLYGEHLHRRSLKYDYENLDTCGLKSEDIEVHFLNDIVANLRPSFLDLIARHGPILKHFRFS